MENNEKLLEAARTIQEHCESASLEDRCPFSTAGGKCNGDAFCLLSAGRYGIPKDWKISRWTDADIALAKALQIAGYSEIKRSVTGVANCMVKEQDDSYFGLPSAFFKAVKTGETVQLSEIIAEGARP